VAVVPQAMEYGESKAARNMVFLMFNDIEQPNVEFELRIVAENKAGLESGASVSHTQQAAPMSEHRLQF
jgi:hypothetical protein